MPAQRVSVSALVVLALAVPAGPAHGNGRPPQTVNVVTQPGDDRVIFLSATFGQLISRDGGATFRWLCEDAIGYGGVFDPDFVIAGDGSLFAGTNEALQISRDGGCTWTPAAGDLSDHWVDEVERDSEGGIWAATATTGRANNVFLSTDNGRTFVGKNMLDATAFWKSLRVAPGDPQRVYVTGYAVVPAQGDGGTDTVAPLLFRSGDRGDSWTRLDPAGVQFGSLPLLELLGVARDNPDVVFARSVRANRDVGDILYRSRDGGASWAEVHRTGTAIRAFVIRQSGDIMVGTINSGDADRVFVSRDGGASFVPAASQPQMSCLAELSSGDLLACGANWEPDFFALARSSDGASWSKLVRFSEVEAAYPCPAQTIQASVCEVELWPALCLQFGCDQAASPPDAGPDRNPGAGCCHAGAGPAGAVSLAALAGLLLFCVVLRRRRAR